MVESYMGIYLFNYLATIKKLDECRSVIDEFFDGRDIGDIVREHELGRDAQKLPDTTIPYDSTRISMPLVVGRFYRYTHQSCSGDCPSTGMIILAFYTERVRQTEVNKLYILAVTDKSEIISLEKKDIWENSSEQHLKTEVLSKYGTMPG